jgi:tetratricopeptide (TPR) repeat protein
MRELIGRWQGRGANAPRLGNARSFFCRLVKCTRIAKRLGVSWLRERLYLGDHQAPASKAELSWAWYERGEALRRSGRYQESLVSFDQALELKPDCVWSWHARGRALVELGRYFEAVASYMTALQLEPTNLYIRCDRAAALANLRRQRQTIRGGRSPKLDLRPGVREHILSLQKTTQADVQGELPGGRELRLSLRQCRGETVRTR